MKHRNIENVTRLSNVQKKIDDSSRKHFLKDNNETNKQEQNTHVNPKRTSTWKVLRNKTVTKNPIFHKIR